MLSEIFDWEKIMSVCYGIFYFLILNILFIISNVSVFAFLFGIGISSIGMYYPLFFLCLLPLGPSLCALFSCMDKLIKNKDIYPFKEYVKAYRKNFLPSMTISFIQLGILFMLITNIKFFANNHNLMMYLFGILFLVILLMTPNLYLLSMKFKMGFVQLLKAALTITIGRPVLTLGNAAAFLIMMVLFEITSGTTFLFMGSCYAFLIVFLNRNLLKELTCSAKIETE